MVLLISLIVLLCTVLMTLELKLRYHEFLWSGISDNFMEDLVGGGRVAFYVKVLDFWARAAHPKLCCHLLGHQLAVWNDIDIVHCTTTLSELHIIIINSSFWWNRCIWRLCRHLVNARLRWVHLSRLVNRRSIFMILDIAVLLELTVTFWYLCLSRLLFGATCLVPDQARHHRKAFLLDLFWCGRGCLVILSWVQLSLTARDLFFLSLESSLSSSWFL